MSTEEQDQIFGRLIRERGESKQKLAALNAKLVQLGRQGAEAGRALQGLLTSGNRMALTNAIEATRQMPAADVIMAALAEFSDEQKRLAEIEEQLKLFEL